MYTIVFVESGSAAWLWHCLGGFVVVVVIVVVVVFVVVVVVVVYQSHPEKLCPLPHGRCR